MKVLRLVKGDIIHLTDGAGNLYESEIISVSGKSCQVLIGRNLATVGSQVESYGKRDYYLHIAIAPTKNIDRLEWFLEKATEIGIDEITPLICEHSERRQLRIDRLEKVITSAMKQSLKAWHPKLNEPMDYRKFIDGRTETGKFIACIAEGVPLLKNIYRKGDHAVILIGPEGDFSPAEVEAAVNRGFGVISLGDSRLRTETAGIVACHTIYLLN
jgi:16S rRNA (uracil1498-N3)-methyltransferase